MEKSKKTLKMIGICIIGLVIVVAVNILKKPEDPFKNDDRVKLGYQHVEESDILNSKDYDSYYEIAFLLNELDKKEESIQMLNTLVNKKPDYYKASELLGSLLCEKEMFKEAINVYQNAIQFDPNNYEIYYNTWLNSCYCNQYFMYSRFSKK